MRRSLKGHFGKIVALHWGGDSKLLLTASQDGNLLLWNAITSNKLQSIALASSYVMAVGLEPTQGQLLASGGLDNLCTVYRRGKKASVVAELASHDGFLSCVRFFDETHLITSSGDSRCLYWDLGSAKPVSSLAEHTADAMFVSIKPDDKHVFLSCSVDQTIKLWDVRTPAQSVQTFEGHQGDVNCVTFMAASGGNCFASCGFDNTARLFDIRAYNELACFGSVSTGGFEGYNACSFSVSGRILYCAHTDSTIAAYDTLKSTTTPAFSMTNAHERNVPCLEVNAAGSALSTGSWDGTVKVWA